MQTITCKTFSPKYSKQFYRYYYLLVFFAAIVQFSIPVSAQKFKSISQPSPSLEEQWLNAVENNNKSTAIKLAGKIIEDSDITEITDPWYKDLFKSKGLNPKFLTVPFNEYDYQLWAHAFFFKKKANEIIKQRDKPVKDIFTAVVQRIKPEGKNTDKPLWPYDIWTRGYGVCDRQALVLAEIAYQAGYESAIIWLMNPKTNVSPHTICVLHHLQGRVWLADPFSDRLLPETSVYDAAASESVKEKLWPGRKDWHDALNYCHIMVPSYPQDCCKRNQELYKRLFKVLKSECPRFGVDPKLRLKYYKYLQSKRNGGKATAPTIHFKIGIYSFLFVELRKQLLNQQRQQQILQSGKRL